MGIERYRILKIERTVFVKKGEIRLFDIFITFFEVSLFTIGGGYAMVPVLAKRLEKKGWMDKNGFYDLLARSQSIPGPVAFNLSLMIGKEIRGFFGGFVGTVGVIIPPFFAIILIGALLSKFSNSSIVIGFLKGAYGAILGLIGGVLYKMMRTRKWNYFEIMMMVIGTFLIVMRSDYVIVIFLFVIIGVYFGDKKWRY